MNLFYLRSHLARYGAALVLVVLAVAVRWTLTPVMADKGAGLFVVPAILLAAMVGGLGPGLFATILGTALVQFFLIPPLYSVAMSGSGDWIRMGALLAVGGR